LDGVVVRERTDDDLPGCVAALRTVQAVHAYPTAWPADPAGWLSPAGLVAAWVAGPAGEDPEGEIIGHVAVVAAADEAVAAYTGTPPDRLVAVTRLFAVPAVRGRGTGAALLAAVTAHAADAGRRLWLDVIDEGGPAIALYERLGWRLVDRRPAGWVPQDGRRRTVRVYAAPTG
jgi:GNAT superfamily N-acetyltransferase